jgi:hypothetical protein
MRLKVAYRARHIEDLDRFIEKLQQTRHVGQPLWLAYEYRLQIMPHKLKLMSMQ